MFALTIKGGLAQSLAPDVCNVPSPTGPRPTPLGNRFQLNQANPSTACQKIFIDGALALTVSSKVLMSQGDEAGTGGGLVSGRFCGPGGFNPSSGSLRVTFEGKNAIAMGAMTTHNGDANFNTNGLCPTGQQTKVMIS
jgi:hypothetical protein